MTMSLLRVGRLRAVLRQAGRAIARAVPWRRAAASDVSPTRFARNGPVRIAYDVRGHGRPLVLVQGVGIGRWGWEPVADRLARRFQVITIDNSGIGAPTPHRDPSPPPPWPGTSWRSWTMPASSRPASWGSASAAWSPRSWPWPTPTGWTGRY